MDSDELKDLMEGLGKGFEEFKTRYDARLDEIAKNGEEIERKLNLQRVSGAGGSPVAIAKPEQWIDTKTRRPVPVLSHADRLADLVPRDSSTSDVLGGSKSIPSVGRFLRGIVVGGRADDAKELAEERKAMSIAVDPSGGYTVPDVLSGQWIDLLRAAMVLSRAGARTVPMESQQLTLARLTGDPVVSWHAENAALTDATPTLGAMTLSARTVVCLVRLSLELSQDSSNIEQILQTSITQALANAIDSAGLVGVTVDAAAAPSGVFNLPDRNTVPTIGAPTSWDFVVDGMYELAADNVDLANIGALVAHPALWKKMRKLKTGIASDNTPLTMPAEVASLPKLWTTAAPFTGGNTCKAIIADWRDLLFGVRKQIEVRVLTQSFMGSNLQIGVLAYARVDFGATRQQSFCTLEGISV